MGMGGTPTLGGMGSMGLPGGMGMPGQDHLGNLDLSRFPYNENPYDPLDKGGGESGDIFKNGGAGLLALVQAFNNATVKGVSISIFPTVRRIELLQAEERYEIARKRSEQLHQMLRVAPYPQQRQAIMAEKQLVDEEMARDYIVISNDIQNNRKRMGLESLIYLMLMALGLYGLWHRFCAGERGGRGQLAEGGQPENQLLPPRPRAQRRQDMASPDIGGQHLDDFGDPTSP